MVLQCSSRLTHKAHATRATADRTGHSHTGRVVLQCTSILSNRPVA